MKPKTPLLPFPPAISLGVALVVLVTFRNCFYTTLIFDDIALIADNPTVQSLNGLSSLLGLSGSRVPVHRVFRNLTYLFDHLLWNSDTAGFHVTNLLIHLLNVFLVAWLLRKVTGSDRIAFFTALFFGVHPVQTDSVTYLAGRRDVLAGLFYLLALTTYFRRSGNIESFKRWGLTVLFFVLGLFSKEHVSTLPAMIVLLEVFIALRETRRETGRIHLRTLGSNISRRLAPERPLILLLFALSLVFALYVVVVHPYNLDTNIGAPRPDLSRGTLARIYGHYVGLWLFPRCFSMDYYPESLPPSPGWGDKTTLTWLVLQLGLGLFFVLTFLRGRLAGLGGLMAGLFLLPMSNLLFTINEPVAEHYLYLPTLGIFLSMVSVIVERAEVSGFSRRRVDAFLGVWIVLLSARTDLRNREWLDPDRIYGATLAEYPRNSRVRNNYARYLMENGRFTEALPHMEVAVAVAPHDCIFVNNHAHNLTQLGRFAEAKREYRRAINDCPEYVGPIMGLGRLHMIEKDFQSAIDVYDQGAPYVTPVDWPLFHWRGVAYRQVGALDKAQESFRKALAIQPGSAETHWHLAVTLEKAGHLEEALAETRSAMEIRPGSAQLRIYAGDLLLKLGRGTEARLMYEKADELKTRR